MEFEKSFWYCVVDVNERPPTTLQCHIFSQSRNMKDQKRHGGGGDNLSTFGHFVPGSTYFVHSFLGYEDLTKKTKFGILL